MNRRSLLKLFGLAPVAVAATQIPVEAAPQSSKYSLMLGADGSAYWLSDDGATWFRSENISDGDGMRFKVPADMTITSLKL